MFQNMTSKSTRNTKRSTRLACTPSRSENGGSKRGEDKTSCMRVVVRVRPLNETEKESKTCVRPMDDHVLVFDPDEASESVGFVLGMSRRKRNHCVLKRRARDLRFIFDRVLGKDASNQEVFEHTTKSITDGVLNGFNCTVFAYGATGAGKTFTMLGTPQAPGVVFQTMMDLYKRIHECREEKTCDVAVSYLEVYNETIRDLLMPGKPLAVREDPQKGVCVSSLTLHKPQSAEELLGMLEYGNNNRTQHPTDANAQSSRSHAVFQVFVRQKERTAGLQADVQLAKMSLIDLAGSERATVTTNRGARFREGANINKSLLALGNCINALADKENKSGHVPYRDSKLTRLLKDSLGGNCQTVMIAAVSPSSLSYEDTYNTLKYADRAKNIKSKVSRNVVSVDFHVHRYAKIVEDLRAEITELKNKLLCKPVNQPCDWTTNVVPQGHAEVQRLCSALKSVVTERATVMKDLIDIEATEQELQMKLHGKERKVERLHLLGADCEILEKARIKAQKCMSNKKTKEKHLSERKAKVEERLNSNQEWLERIATQTKLLPENSPGRELMDQHYKRSIAELESAQLRQKCQHFKKYGYLQEREAHNTNRIVTKLLSIVRKQFLLLKAAGLATPDLCEDYTSAASLIEEDRAVSWADQETGSSDNLKFPTLLCNNVVQFFNGTPKKTPIRVRGFDTPLPKELTIDMTPSRVPVQPKTTINMTPCRVLASPKESLVQDPVRLDRAPQPQINTSPVRILRNESPPSPGGDATISCSTHSLYMGDARMSLNKQFEAVETRSKTDLVLTPKHISNELDTSINNEPDVKMTPERSNKLETISIVSVAQYSPYAVISSSSCEKQNTILPESTSTFCSIKTPSTFVSQSAESGRLKPRFLTPYPKGAWEPSREKTDHNQLANSPEITDKPTNSLDLSGINTMPVTPPRSLAIKPPSFFQSSSAKNKYKEFGTPLKELSVNTQENIKTLHNHGLPSMFDDLKPLETKGVYEDKTLPKRVLSKENTHGRSKSLKRSSTSTEIGARSEKIRKHTCSLRRTISNNSFKSASSKILTTSSIQKTNSKTTFSQRPRWQ